ncbi:hypothetical protein FOA52_013128 [Chlamydomonas sp. UWO 241]|nr:hypothetical protein FOA52_013128 [Chlamydomonas sp. UWO 241]
MVKPLLLDAFACTPEPLAPGESAPLRVTVWGTARSQDAAAALVSAFDDEAAGAFASLLGLGCGDTLLLFSQLGAALVEHSGEHPQLSCPPPLRPPLPVSPALSYPPPLPPAPPAPPAPPPLPRAATIVLSGTSEQLAAFKCVAFVSALHVVLVSQRLNPLTGPLCGVLSTAAPSPRINTTLRSPEDAAVFARAVLEAASEFYDAGLILCGMIMTVDSGDFAASVAAPPCS